MHTPWAQEEGLPHSPHPGALSEQGTDPAEEVILQLTMGCVNFWPADVALGEQRSLCSLLPSSQVPFSPV